MTRPHLRLLVPLLLLAACSETSTGPSHDRIPPAAVTNLEVESTAPGTVYLRWTAPGDDGHAGTVTSYDVRYAPMPLTPANWDSAHFVAQYWTPQPAGGEEVCMVGGIGSDTLYFALKAADEVPNWSPLSNVVSTAVPLALARLSVTDLEVVASHRNSVRLRWTVPGDTAGGAHAVAYDLRYAREAITPETWESASRAAGVPAPGPRGTRQIFELTGLDAFTTYTIALKAQDRLGRWSPLSNVVSVATTVLASFSVTDLAASPGGPCSVVLHWTAPGDSIGGTNATAYEVRYALSPITPDTWVDAEIAPELPPPSPRGTPETFSVSGLLPVARYYFALKAADDQGLWSEVSNPASGTAPVGSITLERLTTSYTFPGVLSGDWSPDGRTIVFESNLAGEPRLYRVPASGGEPQMVSYGRGELPRCSPDGGRIAFVTNPLLVRPELKVMAAVPGATPVQLAIYTADYDRISRPSWSPDGRNLVYAVQTRVEFDGTDNIYVVQASQPGTSVRIGSGIAPVWSPDGTKITYTEANEQPWGLWVMDVDGRNAVRLGGMSGAYRIHACWSPEGARLASSDGNNAWIMSPDGEDAVQLTSAAGIEVITSWSPDGWAACLLRQDPSSYIFDLWILRFERW